VSTYTYQETAPALSSPTVDSLGEVTATLSVTTDKFGQVQGQADGGFVYGAIRLATDPAPTHDDIVLGTILPPPPIPPIPPPPEPPPPEPPPEEPVGTTTYEDTFETGDVNTRNAPGPFRPGAWYSSIISLGPADPTEAVGASQDFARSGVWSMKSEIDHAALPAHYRSQITVGDGNAILNQFGQEYWFAWSMYIPVAFPFASTWQTFGDLHDRPNDWGASNNSQNAPFGLDFRQSQSPSGKFEWHMHNLWTKDPQPSNPEIKRVVDGARGQFFGPVEDDFGKWTDWTVQVVWDFTGDGSGVLRVWKNGMLSWDLTGLGNCYNDNVAPYFKLGCYNGWKQNPQLDPGTGKYTVYYDEIRVNVGGTFNDVAPR